MWLWSGWAGQGRPRRDHKGEQDHAMVCPRQSLGPPPRESSQLGQERCPCEREARSVVPRAAQRLQVRPLWWPETPPPEPEPPTL